MTLAAEKKIDGRLVRDTKTLPQFKVVERDGFKVRIQYAEGKRNIHASYYRMGDEVLRVGMWSRGPDGYVTIQCTVVEQAILRNAFGEFEGKLMRLEKPLPKAFGLHTFVHVKCPTCKRHQESKSKMVVFEKAEVKGGPNDGEHLREGINFVYFFHHWKDDDRL